MATWVTHLMIADLVMKQCIGLDKHGFCIGSIAPDCNVENGDWSCFTPSREVTHWMSKERKVASDSDSFLVEYIINRKNEIKSHEQYSFLLGYYGHLISDAAFQWFIRDDSRVKVAWTRIYADDTLRERAMGYSEDWDSIKRLISNNERMHEIHLFEAEYLRENPTSGYLTEILTLKEFPDYIDYLPHGCIVRKIGVMGYLPDVDTYPVKPISISREEYSSFVNSAAMLVVEKLRENNLLRHC